MGEDKLKAYGKVYIVGIGPGGMDHMTPAASKAIGDSSCIVGYKTYIDMLGNIGEGKQVLSSGMKKEVDRCQKVIELAMEGDTVSLVSSGDCGVYGMAGIMIQLIQESGEDIEFEVVPGVTAANSAAACLGAPIMHDYVTISLSDLLTDWELIKKRIHCAGMGDFVTCIYNPKSKGRQTQIEEARDILLQYKSPGTPVGIVRNAKRDGQQTVVTTLEEMLKHDIDMMSTVIVGNSTSYIKDGAIVTPRGYRI